ncbi:MAG: LysR substrate-binding domain-containing protein [Ideonella sp.]
MAMQDLNDMVLFAEVIEHGGFASAGRALGLPKSRLSRRIARLEQQLGVQLIQRSTRRLSLTTAGELFLRHCVELREAGESAFEAVAQQQTEPRGTVRLSCPVTLAQSNLASLLPIFLARYPQVRVEMLLVNRPVDPVEDGVDLALRVRPQIEDSASLVARIFGRSSALLLASPTYMQRFGSITEPADLAQLETLAMSVADSRSQWMLVGPQGQEHVHVHHPRYVADDLMVLVAAAVAGSGAAMLPDYLCRDELRSGRLIEVLPGWAPPAGIVHAVFPARRALVPAVRRLLDFLVETLAATGPFESAG